ncbi:MAG: Csu type fimbrial protein [Gammaproteobacteria bacterium]
MKPVTAPLLILLLCVGLAQLLPGTLLAATCTVRANPVNFGNYNPLAVAPLDSTGRIRVTCNGNGTLTVALSTGQSSSYNPRYMISGTTTDHLDYNLYTTAARTIIFGDGTGGTQTVSTHFNNNTKRIRLYGQIPALENIAPGNYTDSIIATVTF